MRVAGRVVDEAGAAIGGASVTAFLGPSTTTDAAGGFALTLADGGAPPPLAFAADGRATGQRALAALADNITLADVVLGAVDRVQVVQMPAAGAEARAGHGRQSGWRGHPDLADGQPGRRAWRGDD